MPPHFKPYDLPSYSPPARMPLPPPDPAWQRCSGESVFTRHLHDFSALSIQTGKEPALWKRFTCLPWKKQWWTMRIASTQDWIWFSSYLFCFPYILPSTTSFTAFFLKHQKKIIWFEGGVQIFMEKVFIKSLWEKHFFLSIDKIL